MASTKAQQEELAKLFAKYHSKLSYLYTSYTKRIIKTIPIGEKAEDYWIDNPLFNFDLFPELRERLNQIFIEYFNDNMLCYKQGISDGVALAYSQDDVNLGKYTILQDKAIDTARKAAQTAFYERRVQRQGGLSLSDRVWNYAQMGKSEIETAIANVIGDGITKGTSAEELGRAVRQYLNNPDMMYRRYHKLIVDNAGHKRRVVRWYRRHIDENGNVTFKDEPLEKVGTGTYRSARMNSLRLMRTEINMAYHNANNERWQREPFVIGIRIWLSPEHPEYDICDELMGEYPKNFVFSGWHPNCYSDDTEVLTNKGWKLFKDVLDSDKICSLNPETREIEYVGISQRQKWWKQGDMVHFHNHSLNCLVTPEHRMVYLNKSDGEIRYCQAQEYRKGKGAFYRGCRYESKDTENINIGGLIFNFDIFCEFMGYYLSDGCTAHSHGYRVTICQQEGEIHRQTIIDCIKNMGFNPYLNHQTINFYCKELVIYLSQFGRCNEKYIPKEILNTSQRQIKIFLDAYIKCDGYVKMPKSFINKRGNWCIPKNEERSYYTTSKIMAANLCELILKIGKRPSIGERMPINTTKKDGSVIHGRLNCFTINELQATTATVFEKETVQYNGYVYDLTLKKNHIMYVMRNGTCYWGSNCLCASAPITIQGDEKKEFYRRLMDGEDMSNYVSPNAVKTPPAAWNKYVKDQHDNILAAGERGKLAYHLRDNTKYWLGQFSADEQKRMGFEGKIPQKKLTVDEIKDRFSSIRDKYREIERNYGVPSRAFLNERDKMFEALRGTDIDVMQKQLSVIERKFSAYERWNNRFIERYVNHANELLKKLEDYPVAGRKTLSEALAKKDRDLIIGAFKMAEAKYRYEVSITPDNLRYSKWIETFFGGDKSTALSVHNAIIRAEKAAYTEKTAEEAVIKFSESLLDINIKYSGNKNIIKAIDLYSQREAKRIKDKYLFDELSENIVTNTRYLTNNATKVFSKNIPIKQIDWDAMWYGDIDTLSGVNKSILVSRNNLDTLLEAQKVLEVSQSQTLKSLYDSLIYNYERYGLDYDGGNKLMNQMKDKLAQLSSLSDKKLHDYIFKQRGFLSPDDVRSISDIEAVLSKSVEKVKYKYAKSYYDKVVGIVDDEIMFSKRDFIPQSLLKLKQKIDDAIDYGVSKNILDRYLNDYIHKASVLISYDEQVYAGMRTSLGNIIQRAKNDNIAARTVKNMLNVNEENIIKRLCGADKTEGSCSSLAFSYAGQKGGLDVIDFRDGESRLFFARNTNIGEIVKLRGGYVIDNIEDDYKATKKLLKVMREGHEYYLGVGKHSSVVRKINGELQYLELQSSIQNGWKPFGNIDWKLKDRFGCQHSHSIGNYHFSIINCIIDIDRLILDKNYRKLMEFINTDTLKQNKGIGGGIR